LDGELVLVMPDAVDAIIEVKMSLDGSAIDDVITKLADNVKMIRSEGNDLCKAGLCVYEKRKGHAIHKRVLEHLQLKIRRDLKRAINWLSFGPDIVSAFGKREKISIVHIRALSGIPTNKAIWVTHI
jgi:hypothetical protein